MGSKRRKKHTGGALHLYVTPRIEGDPNGDQAEGEGRKEGRRFEYRFHGDTRGRRNKGLLFHDCHSQKNLTKVCFIQHQPAN